MLQTETRKKKKGHRFRRPESFVLKRRLLERKGSGRFRVFVSFLVLPDRVNGDFSGFPDKSTNGAHVRIALNRRIIPSAGGYFDRFGTIANIGGIGISF